MFLLFLVLISMHPSPFTVVQLSIVKQRSFPSSYSIVVVVVVASVGSSVVGASVGASVGVPVEPSKKVGPVVVQLK